MVGVGFGEEYLVGLADDEGGGEREFPGGFWVGLGAAVLGTIDEGDVDEDAAVVALHGLGDGVGDAELRGEAAGGVGEQGEGALELRGDGDQQRAALAEGGEGGLPGFELGHAVGAPAAAEELDDERADGKQVVRADEFAGGGVRQGEAGGGGADGQDAVFDAGGEEVVDGVVGNGEPLGLHERAGLGGDVVELGLERRHLGSSVDADCCPAVLQRGMLYSFRISSKTSRAGRVRPAAISSSP